jgi:two-component system sensor kinase FixL
MSQPISAATAFVLASQHLLDAGYLDRPALAQTLESAAQELKRARNMLMRLRGAVLSVGNERLPVDVAGLAKAIVEQAGNEAGGKNVHISVEPESLPIVMADAAQIRQVLLNLINNATDAAAEAFNGVVSVRGFYDSAAVEVEIEDNGKGVSSEIANHVFEPFQTTKLCGMGLGLPLSRQIVEAHGGQLWWEAVAPHGTRFHLRLPFNGSADHEG